MSLSPFSQQRLEAWLESSGILSRPCPLCGAARRKSRGPVMLMEAGLLASRWKPNPAAGVPAVAVECTGCGVILTHALPDPLP